MDRHLTTLGALAFAIRRNVVIITQGADTTARPAMPMAGRLHRTVQDGRNRFIWHLTGEDPDKVDDISIGYPLILTSLAPLGTQASVITAMPVDDQLELVP